MKKHKPLIRFANNKAQWIVGSIRIIRISEKEEEEEKKRKVKKKTTKKKREEERRKQEAIEKEESRSRIGRGKKRSSQEENRVSLFLFVYFQENQKGIPDSVLLHFIFLT